MQHLDTHMVSISLLYNHSISLLLYDAPIKLENYNMISIALIVNL